MKQSKRSDYRPRLSRAESEHALSLIRLLMSGAGIRSIYALIELTSELNPSTLYRWFEGAELGRIVELPIDAVRELAAALTVAKPVDASIHELNLLLDNAERREASTAGLIVEFRARRVPYCRALAAIRAAHYRLVAIEDPSLE